jgi:hypothetical protein
MKTSIYDLRVNGRKAGRVCYTQFSASRAAADILFGDASNVRFDNKPDKVLAELGQYLTSFAGGRTLSFRRGEPEPARDLERVFQRWCHTEAENPPAQG